MLTLIKTHFITAGFSEFACEGEEIFISCDADSSILVSSAYYGQYVDCSDGTCCVPHPIADCLESIEETAPWDWLILQQNCTGEVYCSFVVPAGSVFSCVDPYYLDYMTVYFTCLPGNLKE